MRMLGSMSKQLLLQFVGGVIYVIIFSEMFIRIFAPQSFLPRNVAATEIGVRGNIPNSVYWHSTPETFVEFRINSIGMRDMREFAETKPPSVCRIEMFGDSFFMGYELNYQDTIAAQVESLLKKDGFNVEVLNFAVSGFGTAESLKMFEARGVRYSPDIVIFEWHSSDFADNLRSALYRISDGKLEPFHSDYLGGSSAESRWLDQPLFRFLSIHSHFYQFLRTMIATKAARMLAQNNEEGDNPPKTETTSFSWLASPRAIELSRALVLRTKSQSDQIGAKFVLVDIPFRYQGKAISTASFLELPQEISGVNTLTSLIEQDKTLKSVFYQKGQGHFSPLGALVVAGAIKDWAIASNGLERCQTH
jgi:hypothetical protein